jgi:hypothetical protein
VDAPEDHVSAALASGAAERIAAQRICRVDSDTDDVTGRDRGGIELLQRLIDDEGDPEAGWRRCGEHVQPAGGDDRRPEGQVTRVDQVHLHAGSSGLPLHVQAGKR